MENADRAHNDSVYEGIKDIARIPELDFENTQQYAEIDAHQRLGPLVANADVLMVAGAFFGDEAKGKTVDALADCEGIKAVARVNSGENAGHTVFHDGKKFVFHLTPSGIFTGKVNLIGPECVMDPVSYMDHEISQLVNAGVSYQDFLFVGNVQIVTPYHKLLDFLLSPPNSSTLKGMSPVHACKVTKRGIRLDHLFGAKETVVSRLKKDLETYFAVVQRQGKTEEQIKKDCEAMNADGNTRIPKHVVDFVTASDKIEYLIDLYDRYVVKNPKFPHRKDVTYEIRKFLQAGHKVLLEGPQSYWLSNGAEKFWESSTSSDTTAVGLQAAARYNTGKYKHLTINVHKTPASSRVGVGANPSAFVAQDYFSRHGISTLRDFGDKCKNFDAIQKEFWNSVQENGIVKPSIWKEGESEFGLGVAMAAASSLQHGECGATTLKPRVCGLFDCVLHYEVNEAQGPYLTISCFDRGDEYDKVGVVIAYVYYNQDGGETQSNGRVYKNLDLIKAGDPIPTEHVLKHCHPIVKLVDGWKDIPIAAGKRKAGDPLPKGAQDLIGTIEHFTGAEIISIGNGRNQQDLIYVQRK